VPFVHDRVQGIQLPHSVQKPLGTVQRRILMNMEYSNKNDFCCEFSHIDKQQLILYKVLNFEFHWVTMIVITNRLGEYSLRKICSRERSIKPQTSAPTSIVATLVGKDQNVHPGFSRLMHCIVLKIRPNANFHIFRTFAD